jgi:uncharacterized protein with von Willebrand factor type A (vWA) domain
MFRDPTKREEEQMAATAEMQSELKQTQAELKHEQAQAEIMRNAALAAIHAQTRYATESLGAALESVKAELAFERAARGKAEQHVQDMLAHPAVDINRKLRAAVNAAGFGIMETSGDWYIYGVSEKLKAREVTNSLLEKMRNAGLRVGISNGCDTPGEMAAAIIHLRESARHLHAEIITACRVAGLIETLTPIESVQALGNSAAAWKASRSEVAQQIRNFANAL